MMSGRPVGPAAVSVSVGYPGPLALADTWLLEKLCHMNRERIPQRRVFASCAAGAHGVFVPTHDVSDLCCADLFVERGRETPVFVRFSSMMGRAVGLRGMAVKFYTREGNWDLTCGNLPVFYIRDPMLFPDLIHAMDRHPATHLFDAAMVWDFWTLHPESLHAAAYTYSRLGRPDNYRHMHAFCVHTLLWYDADRRPVWIRLRLQSEQGFRSTEEGKRHPEIGAEDMYRAIAMGDMPSWRLECQAMPVQGGDTDIVFDAAAVWPEERFPWRPVGRIILQLNPRNHFAEVEQAAFSPGNLVPGMAPSFDPLLQGAVMACPDAQRYRLGVNYAQLPINAPIKMGITPLRDGSMAMGDNGGSIPAFFPSTLHGAAAAAQREPPVFVLEGAIMRHGRPLQERDLAGAGQFFRSLDVPDRDDLCASLAEELQTVPGRIRSRAAALMYIAEEDWGLAMADRLHADRRVVESLARMDQNARIAATSPGND